MILKNFKIFNRSCILMIILILSVSSTLAKTNSQDSLLSVRDSLQNVLDDLESERRGSTAIPKHLGIYKSIVSVDDHIIGLLLDSLELKTAAYNSGLDEYKTSLAAINDKLDLVNDWKDKLERTVQILVLVLLMLTYYVFKLQRKRSAEDE